jgi:hypothetical protein
VFVFDAGRPVFEIVDADSRRWVMQTFSRTVDPELSMNDLAGLADRLALPDGWRYETHVLDAPLRVDTTTRSAKVLQDDLGNSYSLQAENPRGTAPGSTRCRSLETHSMTCR